MSNENVGIQISRKAFVSSVIILCSLILIAGGLTRMIPPGTFEHVIENGRVSIIPGSYHALQNVHYPIWRWFTAPVEVLWSSDSATVIVIILFLLFIGGSFTILDKSGILRFIMEWVVKHFSQHKYILMSIMVLFFMLFGAFLGIFEELIVLIPIVIALSISLGWDSLVGLGISLLASGFGFSAAITNPFTIGVAQKLAGLPPFSGALYRLLIFILVYAILMAFLYRYARMIEAQPSRSLVYKEDAALREKYAGRDLTGFSFDSKTAKGVKIFGSFIFLIMLVIITGFFVPQISSLSMPVIALLFLIGGILTGHFSEYAKAQNTSLFRDLLKGMGSIAPAIFLILLAMSVKQIMTASQSMDTILYWASQHLDHLSPFVAGTAIYLLVLLLEFFISSGSAKAFLVIPVITPLLDIVGLTRQSGVLAYCFADGFSNLFFPTNATLVIALGLTVVGYPKWFRWTLPVQIVIFLLTFVMLFAAIAFHYGPF